MSITIDEARVAVAGDWHNNATWAVAAIESIAAQAPDVRTILHVGDFWAGSQMCLAVDAACRIAGIERVLVTLGNHEPWPDMTPMLAEAHGEPAQMSEHVFVLPRPYRFTVAGTRVLSLGGASSVDRLRRVAGYNWWEDENITDDMVTAAIGGGECDVMLVHESPDDTPVADVARMLRDNPYRWPLITLEESRQSRRRVSKVWDATGAPLLFHGHMHTPGAGIDPLGRRVISLGRDGQPRNTVIWDVRSGELDDVVVER